VDYKYKLPQILYKAQQQQQQTPPAFHQTLRIWNLQNLNTLDSTISPYLMKTNSWLLVLDLIESETVLAKTTYIQSSVSYNSMLVFHILKIIYQTNNRLFARKIGCLCQQKEKQL